MDILIAGLPTAKQLRRKIGRQGMSAVFKRKDHCVDEILTALRQAEAFFPVTAEVALAPLRSVRKAVFNWNNAFRSGRDTASAIEKHEIESLRTALDKRIQKIAEVVHGGGQAGGRAADEAAMITRQQFQAFHDTAMRRAPVGRTLDPHYHPERQVPGHLPADVVRTWRESGSTLGLETWYRTVYLWRREDDPHSSQSAQRERQDPRGVRYLDAQERVDFRVDIVNGVVRDNAGELFHTGAFTSQSGDGWGIYVIDHYMNIYFGAHSVDRFHHSSFMAGGPVLAAGEVAVDRGRIVGVTNKTGHYKAGPRELKEALLNFQIWGVDMARVKVSDPFRTRDKWYTGEDAIAADGNLADIDDARCVGRPARVPA